MNSSEQEKKSSRAMLRNARRTWFTIEDTFIHHIEKNDQYDENDPIHKKSTRMDVSFRMISEDEEDVEDLKVFFLKEHPEWVMNITLKDERYVLKGELPKIRFSKITKDWYYKLLGYLQHYSVEFMCEMMPISIHPEKKSA